MTQSTNRAAVDPARGRWGQLAVLAVAMVLAMTTWFSASAVIPQLREQWGLTTNQASLLTIAVQLGFVVGAVLSATINLSDVVAPRRVILAGAAAAALANIGLLVVDGPAGAILLRFATGAALAGVYPPAMKQMSTWFKRDRGLALGVMVGALTLGSAVPHLVNGSGGLDWRVVIGATSALTLAGGLLALVGGRDGPFPFPRAAFDPRQVLTVFRHRGVRLASIGYFGHMWELYAMWAWIGAFATDVYTRGGSADPARAAAFTAFAVIGIGAAGSVVGGRISDRRGRAWLAAVSLAASGSVAAVIGFARSGPTPLVVVLALVWGFWIVADSAQFSTVVTEVADQRYVGTALTMQLAVGFSLTVVTIWLVPLLVDATSWTWAFVALVPGPVVGVVAMIRLHADPGA